MADTKKEGVELPICEDLRRIARFRLANPDLAIEWRAAGHIENLYETLLHTRQSLAVIVPANAGSLAVIDKTLAEVRS